MIHEGAARFEAVGHADPVGDHHGMVGQSHFAVCVQHSIESIARGLLERRADRRFGVERLRQRPRIVGEQRSAPLPVEVEVAQAGGIAISPRPKRQVMQPAQLMTDALVPA